MDVKKILLTKNDCYKAAKKMTPVGIIVHSTGANNKKISRYVQPDDGIIGVNNYSNDWNRSGVTKCVHAFIGVDKDGTVRVYQTLPYDYKCWGCGSGKKGSYNSNYIQFEICEDALTDKAYFEKAFKLAAEYCAYLMKKYPAIKLENVISHNEAYKRGYATNHGDCDSWLKKFGKNMDWFRDQVKAVNTTSTKEFNVKVKVDALNVRAGAGTNYKVNTVVHKDDVFTIVKTSGNWGQLKSGAGWINISSSYVTRV